jgi:cholesterol transport system auxiliary component
MLSPQRRLLLVAGAAALTGCGTFVDRPQRPTLFDLGALPSSATPAAANGAPGTPLVLPDVEAAGALEGSNMLYRLAYADDHQLRAYALSRWSAPPPQLVRQRLRQQLGRERPVLSLDESAALAREGDQPLHLLRLELEEFTHVFDAPDRSRGVLRLRATLIANTRSGDVLVGQRAIVADGPAPTPDASGGVRALTSATDAAAADIGGWLQRVGRTR